MKFNSLNIQDLQLDHSIDISPNRGTASIGISIPTTESRGGVNPLLSLQYNSSPRNSLFGIGWSMAGMSFINLDTKKGLPKYDGSDNFAFNGSNSLVPYLIESGPNWKQRIHENTDYWIYYYRSELEGDFTRFEKWIKKTDGTIHWRTRSKTDIISIYGLNSTKNTRLVDPQNPSKQFLWLLEAQYHSSGNAIFYQYKPEDALGVNPFDSFEANRLKKFNNYGFSQKYPEKIIYGNTKPIKPDTSIPVDNKWLFEVVFDYGNYPLKPFVHNSPSTDWATRQDPFSIYSPGFEIRTYRLCRRILMFHHFDELSTPTSLVGIFNCNYNEKESGTTLESVSYTGVRRDLTSGNYSEKTLPPLKLKYTQPSLGTTFKGIVKETSYNFPQGLNSSGTQIVDLFGEGLAGILTESNNAWYYKPNLGDGVFGQQEIIISKPSHQTGAYALGDFDRDGNLDLFSLQGRTAGYYEYHRESDKWSGFKTLDSIPQVSHAKFLDVNSDGLPDLILETDEKIVCYPSKGKEGFDKPYEFSKPVSNGTSYAPTIGANLNLDYFLTDMTGDSLPDQVQIKNGRVEYFPNLGNGHFGPGIVMENPPIIDFENSLDSRRIRFYDLDGSGTSDIIYIGNGEIRYWYNAAGNRFLEGGIITNLPYIDNISSALILDFLGNGTPCLVWSSSLNHLQYSSVQYLQLTNGIQPGLLTSLENSMGKEVKIEYNTSAQHHLRDQKTSTPWISKLPGHFTVVNKTEIIDHISNTRFVTQYKYKDGHYDGRERAFVTFGLVEQYDTEIFESPDPAPATDYAQPTCVRRWFHNGMFGGEAKRLKQYYGKDAAHSYLNHQSFETNEALGSDEFSQAYRSLAGLTIRQELYASSPEGEREEHPYQISQTAFKIRKLQPTINKKEAAFLAYQSQALIHDYEKDPNDPKISHHLTLAVDNYGEVEKQLTIAYARRTTVIDAEPAQKRDYITASIHNHVHTDNLEKYETGILYEWKDYEINHLDHPPDTLVKPTDITTTFDSLINNALNFDVSLPLGGISQARLTSWEQTFFWDNSFSTNLALGQVGEKTFSHHEASACFNDNHINQVYGGKVTPAMLTGVTEGHYEFQKGYWWQKSQINHFFSEDQFYSLEKVERPGSGITAYTYDPYFLNIIEIIDPLGNTNRGEIDYNIIEPFRLVDQNDNISEVLYDALGVTIASSNRGTVMDAGDTLQPYGNELVSSYSVRPDESFENILNSPADYLQQAGTYFFYEFENWDKNQNPLRSIIINRENLIHDGTGQIATHNQLQISFAYFDGFGRTIQSKRKMEPGNAIKRLPDNSVELDTAGIPVQEWSDNRWLVSGHVVFNNKLKPVRQFEPFFSSLIEFESDEVLKTYGVSTVTHYDALGRALRTDSPNGTFTEVKISPWEIQSFDPNDTVDRSSYKDSREIQPVTNPERIALDRAMAHKETPTIVKIDPLAREIVRIQVNNDGTERRIENLFDINGNISEIIDARSLSAFVYKRDMLGRTLYEKSMDGGEYWSFHNNLDQTIHLWDGRNIHQRTHYDELDRVVSVHIDGALGLNQITEKFIYGEENTLSNRKEKNLRGQLIHNYDQAGTLEVKQYTPSGLPLVWERRLLDQFTQEPDWTDPATVPLDADTFTSAYVFDALGRPLQQKLPDQTTRKFLYHQGGGIRKVLVSTADGQLSDEELLKETAYDAKGLRQYSLLGNEVEQHYNYDAETFRMTGLKAVGHGRTYQDINYTYDPVGNLVYIVDQAQQPAHPAPHVITGLNVSAHSEFEYDALYQLKSAKGRVHQALVQQDYHDRSRENALPADWIKGTRHITLNNGAAVERYTREYQYDKAGNIKTIKHMGSTQNWTKQIWTSPTSNRSLPLEDLTGSTFANPENRFDANGNCTSMPHLRIIEWNYRNNISKAVVIDRSAQSKPDDVEYYVYGGDGIRVRKVTQRVVDITNDTIELTEKIYLEGCEIKRRKLGAQETLKRFTSHISDGTNNIALIHTWEKDTLARETDNIALKKINYQLTNHLGSAALELDEAGNVITYEEYFPYGGTSFVAGKNKREIDLKDYRYSGKERDDYTGLYYFGYRYYAHWIGGWLSPDPLGPEDSENLYLFVHNNPINLIDPNGLDSTTPRGELYTADAADLRGAMRASAIRFQSSLTPEVLRRYEQQGLTHVIYDHSTGEFRAVSRAAAEQYLRDLSDNGIDSFFITAEEPEPEPEPDPEDIIDTQGGTVEITFEEGAIVIGNEEISLPSEDNADTTGGVSGASGEAADSTGTGGPEDTNGGAVNNGTDGDTQTQTNGGGGGGNTGTGTTTTGTTGTNRGHGRTGTETSGGGKSTTGTQGTGGRGTGTGTGSGTGTGASAGRRPGAGQGTRTPGNGTGNGQIGGHPLGSPEGAIGGEVGGSDGGSLEGDINGVPDGIPNGSLTGSPGGTETGEGGQGAGGQETGPGQSTQAQGGQEQAESGANEEQQRQPDSGETNWMDTATRWTGYLNLEFGSNEPGEAGGIPGGMNLFNLDLPMWARRTLQVAYIATTIITTVIPIGKLAIAAKVAVQGALKVGLRATARKVLTAIAAKIPSRAGINAALQRVRGGVSSRLSRLGGALKKPLENIRNSANNLINKIRGRQRTFYTVQDATDSARLRSNGLPWPTDPDRAALGEGVYAWGNLDDASGYLSRLQRSGVDLEIVPFKVRERFLQRFRQLDIDSLPDPDTWMNRYSRLWGGTADHGLEYITRNTAIGVEHYFHHSIFSKLKF